MTKKIHAPSKQELEEKYTQFGVTISSLARDYNVSNPVIRKWLIEYNIPRKDQKTASTQANNKKKSSPPSKDILESLYQTKSIDELEKIFSVGQETIYHWLNLYRIRRKTLSEACKYSKNRKWNSIIPSKESFLKEYERTKNLKALEAIFGLSATSIKRLVKEYEVETHKPWRSIAEIELHKKIEELTNTKWVHSNKSIINPFELDLVCISKNLAIEYCGLYWHSEISGNKSKDYHLKKLNVCKEKGYDLITIFESDDVNKVLSLIQNKLGLSKKIYARHCRILEIDVKIAKEFNEKHHLHGHHSGSVNLGLFYNNELVMLLTMGKSRFNQSFEWECIRMTTAQGITVVGGASKLFNFFRKEYNPLSIVTYSDRRFGEGEVYLKCGFKRIENTPPNYWYFSLANSKQIFSRVIFQKHKLTSFASYDDAMTEWEIMKASNYDRIWDCGNAKYIWYK